MRRVWRAARAACLLALASTTLAAGTSADGLTPGSVLVYPIHRTGIVEFNIPPSPAKSSQGVFFTVVAVTNTNLKPITPINGLGGSTNAHFEFVEATPNPQAQNLPLDCQVLDRVEFLTPGDTLSLLTSCPDITGGVEGYVVVTAQDPNAFDRNWSHDYLVGCELVLRDRVAYTINAIPFDAIPTDGLPTDLDFDDQVDFDGVEYEPLPDHVYLDHIVTDGFQQSVALINFSGGTSFTATVAFDIFNDNERPLSATLSFRCWVEEFLADVSAVFSPGFLAANTQHDPLELDIDCDGSGDLETAWARLRGLTVSSNVESYPNPAILAAHTRIGFAGGGRRAWESEPKQTNGDFLKTGTDDPEFP